MSVLQISHMSYSQPLDNLTRATRQLDSHPYNWDGAIAVLCCCFCWPRGRFTRTIPAATYYSSSHRWLGRGGAYSSRFACVLYTPTVAVAAKPYDAINATPFPTNNDTKYRQDRIKPVPPPPPPPPLVTMYKRASLTPSSLGFRRSCPRRARILRSAERRGDADLPPVPSRLRLARRQNSLACFECC